MRDVREVFTAASNKNTLQLSGRHFPRGQEVATSRPPGKLAGKNLSIFFRSRIFLAQILLSERI
jgi:hypothetical protein